MIRAGVANLGIWNDQVAALRDACRVIRYDARGFGARRPSSRDSRTEPTSRPCWITWSKVRTRGRLLAGGLIALDLPASIPTACIRSSSGPAGSMDTNRPTGAGGDLRGGREAVEAKNQQVGVSEWRLGVLGQMDPASRPTASPKYAPRSTNSVLTELQGRAGRRQTRRCSILPQAGRSWAGWRRPCSSPSGRWTTRDRRNEYVQLDEGLFQERRWKMLEDDRHLIETFDDEEAFGRPCYAGSSTKGYPDPGRRSRSIIDEPVRPDPGRSGPDLPSPAARPVELATVVLSHGHLLASTCRARYSLRWTVSPIQLISRGCLEEVAARLARRAPLAWTPPIPCHRRPAWSRVDGPWGLGLGCRGVDGAARRGRRS